MTWISPSLLAVSLDAFVIWKKVALDAARLALDHLAKRASEEIHGDFS